MHMHKIKTYILMLLSVTMYLLCSCGVNYIPLQVVATAKQTSSIKSAVEHFSNHQGISYRAITNDLLIEVDEGISSWGKYSPVSNIIKIRWAGGIHKNALFHELLHHAYWVGQSNLHHNREPEGKIFYKAVRGILFEWCAMNNMLINSWWVDGEQYCICEDISEQ